MYKIAMRNGSPVNVGQMIEIDKGSAIAEPGSLICIVDGVAVDMTLGVCPDALVSSVDGDKVTAMLLTEDMILEVPIFGESMTYLKTGALVTGEADSVNIDETGNYCQIVDTLDAKKAGDKILVRFIHNNKKS